MTVKKVNPGDELQSELQKVHTNQGRRVRRHGADGVHPGLGDDERIEVGLGKAINSELNAEQMLLERKEKVEKLKKLIAAGEYKPSSYEVAQAVGQEIVLEILSNPKEDGDFFQSE